MLAGLLGGLCSATCCVLPGKTAAVDSEAIYKHLLTDIPAQLFHNPSLAFEFVQFCKENSRLFTETSSIFRQSFPNLFKVQLAGAAEDRACCTFLSEPQNLVFAFQCTLEPFASLHGSARESVGKKDCWKSRYLKREEGSACD